MNISISTESRGQKYHTRVASSSFLVSFISSVSISINPPVLLVFWAFMTSSLRSKSFSKSSSEMTLSPWATICTCSPSSEARISASSRTLISWSFFVDPFPEAMGVLNLPNSPYHPQQEKVSTTDILHGAQSSLTFTDDELFQPPFPVGSLEDLCFDGICRHKSVHQNGFCLANTMHPILCLKIHLRVLQKRGKKCESMFSLAHSCYCYIPNRCQRWRQYLQLLDWSPIHRHVLRAGRAW